MEAQETRVDTAAMASRARMVAFMMMLWFLCGLGARKSRISGDPRARLEGF